LHPTQSRPNFSPRPYCRVPVITGQGGRMSSPTDSTARPTPPPPIALMQMMMGFYLSRALYVAARLGLADLIAAGTSDAEALARATETHAPSLRRLMRWLASNGIFTEDESGSFALTPLGECLRSGVPGSMRASTILFTGITQDAWSELL